MSERYIQSETLLERALKVIPLGSQTFSKSITQYPLGVSPYFLDHGQGADVVDVDGNRYTDFVSGLCAVSLGYCDPDVDAAISKQLRKGISFSLSTRLEAEVAEQIVEMVPCAEKVRFAKNGSDATSGAIRLARAATGRDRVAVCGYHGWQDWYIASTTLNLGIPKATQDLTHKFSYNDVASLQLLFDQYPGQIAAVIIEPMNVVEPKAGFLEDVKAIASRNGAVLVFDETITGFRFSNGGAQAVFGVTPDLATFGKACANGMPLSVLTGRADLMDHMDRVFLSGTFGGETLSLAACKAVLEKLSREPVVSTIAATGESVKAGVAKLITDHGCGAFLSISGHPSWSFLNFKDTDGASLWHIKTLFLQEILARGILSLGTHNVMYAHTQDHVNRLLAVYDEVFSILANAVWAGNVTGELNCKPLEPLFKVR